VAFADGDILGSATNPYEFLMSFFIFLIMLLTRLISSDCDSSSSASRMRSSSFEIFRRYLWRERRLAGTSFCVLWRKVGWESYLVFLRRRHE